MIARLSLSYGPSLCLSSALSQCLCAVRVLCHMDLVACNKSSFVRSFVQVLLLSCCNLNLLVYLSIFASLMYFCFFVALLAVAVNKDGCMQYIRSKFRDIETFKKSGTAQNGNVEFGVEKAGVPALTTRRRGAAS